MNALALDTSVLIAIFKGENSAELWLRLLERTAESASLLVSSVVLAEVRSYFADDAKCTNAMERLDVMHSALSEESAMLAGKIFREYRREGGPRTTILPDFLVAAHAAVQADAIATEDRGYLRRYFPKLKIVGQ
jgi:predicted nucleic acid-binding protein